MAVRGRHGAKAKMSSPVRRARASAPLGLPQPVAPAVLDPQEPRGEPRKRRSPRAIARRTPRWLLLWLWPSHGAGDLAGLSTPAQSRSSSALRRWAMPRARGRCRCALRGVCLEQRGTGARSPWRGPRLWSCGRGPRSRVASACFAQTPQRDCD
jgi:hypothetical protein